MSLPYAALPFLNRLHLEIFPQQAISHCLENGLMDSNLQEGLQGNGG